MNSNPPDTWELWLMCGRWGQAPQLQPSNQDPSVARVKRFKGKRLTLTFQRGSKDTMLMKHLALGKLICCKMHRLINSLKALPWWASELWRIPWYHRQQPRHHNNQNCHRSQNSFGDVRNKRLCWLGSFDLFGCNCTLPRKACVLSESFSFEEELD